MSHVAGMRHSKFRYMLETLCILKYQSVTIFRWSQSAGNRKGASETTRGTSNDLDDDIVRTAWRHAECGRNDRTRQQLASNNIERLYQWHRCKPGPWYSQFRLPYIGHQKSCNRVLELSRPLQHVGQVTSCKHGYIGLAD